MAKKKGNALSDMFISLLKLRHQLNIEEREGLLTELMGCYLVGDDSSLMELLMKKDLPGFRKRFNEMNEGGEKIRRMIKGEKNNESD